MSVSDAKQQELCDRMQQLGINEHDFLEQFILGSGKGGQKINKTASCVVISHKPTGLIVKCQQSRSRELNRFLAKRLLIEKLEGLYLGKQSAKEKKNEKIRRQKKRRQRRSSESTSEQQETIEIDL